MLNENKTIELKDEQLEKVAGGEEEPNVIIDKGTGYKKAGFQGEEGPRAVFPAVTGGSSN